MEKILIVEDDKNISDLLSIHLHDLGFEADCVYDGKEGLVKALNNVYKLMVLDIRLPGMDGFEICKRIRQEYNQIPIIMLTSKSEEIDKVLGLEIGADDYMTKPFSIREFVARVKTILRRGEINHQISTSDKEEELSYDHFYINISKRIVKVYDNQLELSPKEFDLLVFLASHPGKTFTRMQLLSSVWGVEFEGFEHTVNSHINRLRSKVEKNMNEPEFILTTWGVGYKFKDDV